MDALNLTGQGEKEKRRDLDFYPTPENVTVALMNFLTGIIPEGSKIWEPASGNGAMSKIIESYGHDVFSSDIQENCYGQGNTNFLETEIPGFFAIITNPPFKESAEFIRHALKQSKIVAMVFKSQYWHAEKRTKLFKENPPAYILPLNWRPDFKEEENSKKGKKGAPTMEVQWAVWIAGENDTRYRILEK